MAHVIAAGRKVYLSPEALDLAVALDNPHAPYGDKAALRRDITNELALTNAITDERAMVLAIAAAITHVRAHQRRAARRLARIH